MEIGLVGAKGGVGTTTTAVLLWMAAEGNAALVTTDDGFAAAGLPSGDGRMEASDGKVAFDRDSVSPNLAGFDLVVRDGQRGADRTYLVTEACYLALRRVVGNGEHFDGIILIEQAGRALRAEDVSRAVGASVVAVIQHDPAIARLVDAGLLYSRPPKAVAESLGSLASRTLA